MAKHLDEARAGAVSSMLAILEREHAITAAVIVDDLYGRISVTIWNAAGTNAPVIVKSVQEELAEACQQLWTGAVVVSDAASPDAERELLNQAAWREGIPVAGSSQLRLNDRHRHHTGWFVAPTPAEQLWTIHDGPPVVVFHGFKGGAGRTTLLASYALARARRGQHVAVVDVDLDAPGVGLLLAADANGATSQWGTIDFLLEATHDLPIDDYFHVCARDEITGSGRVEVFPAGSLDDAYLSKLGRIDLDVRAHVRGHALGKLLQRIHAQRAPDLILLDGRAGLSPAAGLLLSGIAHLHVLVATSNMQSLQGLERVVRHLGFEQARRELPQGECIVVQAHVPDSTEAAKSARGHFAMRVEQFFRDGYYTSEPTEDDRTWSLRDLESEVAPHVPVPITYRGRLAHFERIEDVADLLVTDPEYIALHQRIDERLGAPEIEVEEA